MMEYDLKQLIRPRHLVDLFLSLPLFAVSLLGTGREGDFGFYVGFVLAYLALQLGINNWIVKRENGARLLLVLPFLFALGFLGLQAAISSPVIKVILGIASAVGFYFYQSNFPKQKHHFLEDVFNVVALFVVLAFLWSLNFFFAFSWWLLLILIFVTTALLFWQAFYKMGIGGLELRLITILSAISVVEISWATLYLPVYFITAAVIGFSGAYLIYMLSHFYFRKGLTKDKIYFQVGMIVIVLLLSLLSSPWSP